MDRGRKIPNVGDEGRIHTLAHAAVFRMLLSFLDTKLEAHLDAFSGSENLPAQGPVIIVPNHQSYFDGFVLTVLFWKLTGRKVRIPTNIKALTDPLTTFFQVAGGAVPIDPRDSADTYARLSCLLRKGEAVVIYPEGTRSDGTMLHPFKYGAFNLAVDLGVPVLPVAVRNFANILPKGSMRFRHGETGSITFGKLIDPADPAFAGGDNRARAAQICHDVQDWIARTAFAPQVAQDIAATRAAEVSALARRADRALEGLLDQGAEFITRAQAAEVLRIVSTRRILGTSDFDLDLQELRAVGFRVAALPPHRALPALWRYGRMLRAAHRSAPAHPYLNYCLGLLHLKLPRLLGGGRWPQAVELFSKAHANASAHGYAPDRFVHGYASALARNGDAAAARTLLHDTFAKPGPETGLRELRRRERGMSLMRKLELADPTARTLPSRGLRGFELVMAQSRISDIVVAQIEGLTNLAQVFDAASALQQRHPGLRARVTWPAGRDRRPVFEYLPADLARLHVREELPPPGQASDPRPFWQQVAEREVNHLFDLSDGYMFRVVWLPESGHIILNAQHAVVDGLSLMRLLHEFAVHCSGGDIGPELPPTPSALESGPRISMLEKTVGWFHRETFIRARRRFADWSTLPIAGRLEAGAQLRTECHFEEGDSDHFTRITEAGRARGVTLGGAYAAAIQCAMLHFSNSTYPARTKYYVPMDFSLRRYIPGGDVAQDAVGLFSGGAPVIFRGDPGASFWQIARTFMETSRGEIDMKSPLIFHQVFDHFWNLEEKYRKYGLDCGESGGAGSPLTMSNVGRFPYPAQNGPLRITTLHGMSASQKGGSMLYFWLRSINGRLFYSATSIHPATTRAFAADFLSLVVYLMETCTDPAADDLPIRDYIPAKVAIWSAARAARPVDHAAMIVEVA